MKNILKRMPLIGAICTTLTIVILVVIIIFLCNNNKILTNKNLELENITKCQSDKINNLTNNNTQLQSQINKITKEKDKLSEDNKKLKEECDELSLKIKQQKSTSKASIKANNNCTYSAAYFKKIGVINWNGYRWTWYSQRVLPGGGLKIPGRHVDNNGYVCDENNYICLASSTLKYGTVINTPFGKQGKIYDSGCAAGTVDVYVNW